MARLLVKYEFFFLQYVPCLVVLWAHGADFTEIGAVNNVSTSALMAWHIRIPVVTDAIAIVVDVSGSMPRRIAALSSIADAIPVPVDEFVPLRVLGGDKVGAQFHMIIDGVPILIPELWKRPAGIAFSIYTSGIP